MYMNSMGSKLLSKVAWIYMDPIGTMCTPRKQNESTQNYVDSHGSKWICLDLHECVWVPGASPSCLLGASWVAPAWIPCRCLLGVSWRPPGCRVHFECFLGLLGASRCLLSDFWVNPGCFAANPNVSCVLSGAIGVLPECRLAAFSLLLASWAPPECLGAAP